MIGTTADQRIRKLRAPKPWVDPWRAHGSLVEEERRPEPQAQARARAQPQPRRPAQPAIADSSDAYKEGMRESVYAQQQKAERERAKIEAAAK